MSFTWSGWLRSFFSRPRTRTFRKRRSSSAFLGADAFASEPIRRRFRPAADELESRILLAVDPVAQIGTQQSITIGTTILGGSSASVAQDPINPLKLVEVHTNVANTAIVSSFST